MGCAFAPPAVPSDFAFREIGARLPSPRGDMPNLSPPPKPRVNSASPRPLRGAIMRRREAGRGAAPASLVATRHSGGIGAPPGATRSSCQELADGSVGAFERDGPTKAGPGAGNAVIGAPQGARVILDRELQDLRFSARHPPHTPGARASRQGDRMPKSPHASRHASNVLIDAYRPDKLKRRRLGAS